MTEQPTLLAPINEVEFALGCRFPLALVREPRHPCPACLRRRVLYRIAIDLTPPAQTGAQCAECWGLR